MILLKTDNPLHPDLFLRIEPPIGVPLWMEGMIDSGDARAIAIVGTRKPSRYGIGLARDIATRAAKAGWTVVSGFARGIDTEAHRAALAAGGRTIAVLGTGLDAIYPEENIALVDEVSQQGALLSQFPPGTGPLRHNFPIRNRTIALLARHTVVVEAGEQSGSLITARHAIEAGRKVFVAPGPVGAESFRGNHLFLQQTAGNRLVTLLTDLDLLFAGETPASAPTPAPLPEDLSPEERRIVTALAAAPRTFDEIVEETDIPAFLLPATLLPLLMRGLVVEEPGNQYRMNH